MSEQIKVGDTLWCTYDSGRRDLWVSAKIIGETKQSWLLEPTWASCAPCKVNKKTMLQNMGRFSPDRWYTRAAKVEKEWVDAHRHRIVSFVSVASIDQLLQIAAIVGYDPEAKR